MSQGTELDYLRDLPAFKAILKAVLRSQIQLLVYQLAEHTGEESILLSANVKEGTLSHMGSESGNDFLSGHIEVKKLFLGHCLDRYKERKPEAAKSSSCNKSKLLQMLHSSSPRINPYSLPRKKSYRSQCRSLRNNDGSSQYIWKSGELKLINFSDNISGTQSVYPSVIKTRAVNVETIKSESETDKQSDNEHHLVENVIIKTEPVDYDLDSSSSQYKVECALQLEPDLTKISPIHVTQGGEPLLYLNSSERKSTDTTENKCRLVHQPLASDTYTSSGNDFQVHLNQSSECVLKPGLKVRNKFVCETPDDSSRLAAHIHSKRKNTMPMRISKQSADSLNSVNNVNSSLFMQSMDLASDKSIHQESSRFNNDSDDVVHALNGSIQKSANLELGIAGHLHFPTWKQERVNDVFPSSFDHQESHGNGHGSPLGQESALGYCSADEVKKWGKHIKTPQVDGMLVTRGEGRYEKLIRCDTCGKVCRTSNMARHRKRYCLDSIQVVSQPKKSKVSDDSKGINSHVLGTGSDENEMPAVMANNITFETLSETLGVKQELPDHEEWITAGKMS